MYGHFSHGNSSLRLYPLLQQPFKPLRTTFMNHRPIQQNAPFNKIFTPTENTFLKTLLSPYRLFVEQITSHDAFY